MTEGFEKLAKRHQLNDHGRMHAVWGYVKDDFKKTIPLYLRPSLEKIVELQNGNIISGKYNGRARFTQNWLADKLELTTRAIGTQLRKLAELGLIIIYRTFNPETHRYEINQYSISDILSKILSSATVVWHKFTKIFKKPSKSPEEVNFRSITVSDSMEEITKDSADALSAAEEETITRIVEDCPKLEQNSFVSCQDKYNLLQSLNFYYNRLGHIPHRQRPSCSEFIMGTFKKFQSQFLQLQSEFA